jgi:hypothetical protein
MKLESTGLRKILILVLCLVPASLVLLSCGATPSGGGSQTSGIKYRAFLTNNVSAGTATPGIYIVNAQKDTRGPTSPVSAGNTPGMMVVSPNHAQTIVFSGSGTQFSDNQLSFINNASESNAAHVTLPGMTESIVISPDGSAAYVAVPTATVVGQSPGILEALAMSSGTVTGQVNIPALHYISQNNGGDRLFGFSDNSDYVSVITPSQIGIGNAVTSIGGPGIFDRPVAAFFTSDDTIAYVVNCGPECGGTQASVQMVELTPTNCLPTGICPAVSVQAATEALIVGSTMYLAGTPYSAGAPSQPCTGEVTAATTCGLLTVFDLTTMSVTSTAVITDGYHNRIAMGANGQLFIGARTCTEIIPPTPAPAGAEIRGCLSIYNSLSAPVGSVAAGGVLIPPENGDATGIQPISTRQVVYVVQGGSLNIYDDTTDALEYNPNNPNNPGLIYGIIGNFIDVKTVDF